MLLSTVWMMFGGVYHCPLGICETSCWSVTHLFLQCVCDGWGRCSFLFMFTRSGKPTKSAEMQSRNGACNNL